MNWSSSRRSGLRGRGGGVVPSLLEATATEGDTTTYEPDSFAEIDRMQAELEVLRLAAGAAGLSLVYRDGSKQLERFEFAVNRLEQLTKTNEVQFPASLPSLGGRWKLVYSSVPVVAPPGLRVCDVTQTIMIDERRFENEVVFAPAVPWKALASRMIEIRLSIGGQFQVYDLSTLELEIIDVRVRSRDPRGTIPGVATPPLTIQPPSGFANDALRMTGKLDTTYLSRDVRIGRGDRGEFRVFVRA